MPINGGVLGGPPLTGGTQIPAIGGGGGGRPEYIGAAPADGYYLLWSADARLTNAQVFPGPMIETNTGVPPTDTAYLWRDASTVPAIIKYYDAGTVSWVPIATTSLTILHGSGVPGSGLGVDGNYYINTDPATGTGDMYLKASGAWSLVVNLAGPPGASLNPIGPWSNLGTYNANDLVTYGGSSYLAIATSTNVTPGTDPTKWFLLVAGDSFTVGNSATDTNPDYLSFKLDASSTFTWTTTSPGGAEKSKLDFASAAANKVMASPDGISGIPGPRSLVTNDLPDSGVVAGTYVNPNVNIDSKGRITGASDGSGGALGVGGSGVMSIAPAFQVDPTSSTFTRAPLIVDRVPGDTNTGYRGNITGNYVKTTAFTTNMSARWLITESSGTTLHDSVTTPTNDLTISSAGAVYGTDAAGSYWNPGGARTAAVTAGIVSNTGDMTAEVFVKGTAIAVGARTIFCQGVDNGSAVFTIFKNGSNYGATSIAVGLPFNFTSSVAHDEPVSHIVLTYTSSSGLWEFYVNGVLEGSGNSNPRRSSGAAQTQTILGGQPPVSGGGSANPQWQLPIYYAALYNQHFTGADVLSHYNELINSADVGNTALLDLGANGFAPGANLSVTRGWTNNATEVCEYSLDGLSWTNIFTNTVNNSGTFAYLTTSQAIALSSGTWRYVRYSLKDTGGSVAAPSFANITDFRVM